MEKLDLFYSRENCNIYHKGIASEIPDRISQPLLQRRVETLLGRRGLKASYNTGKSYMKSLFNAIDENKETTEKKHLNLMLKHLSQMGFGALKCLELDEKYINIRVINCFNAIPYGRKDKKTCFEMAGVLAACGEVLTGEGMDCMETECITQGAPFCEFHVFKHGIINKKNNKQKSTINRLISNNKKS